MKMKNSYALLLLALLIIPVLSVFPVQASTGSAKIGGIDTGNVITIATSNVSVKAGEMALAKIDGAAVTGKNLVIIFDNVLFSGAQFNLYLSKDGYSHLGSGDIEYAAGFRVSDLALAPTVVNITNAYLKDGTQLYTIGLISGQKVVVGPIPFDISADYKYVKIYDGEYAVAVGLQTIEVLPALSLTPTPTSGGACTSVTLTAVALAASTLVNITYTSPASIAGLVAQVMTGADGKLTYTWAIADLKNDYNSIVSQPIVIALIYNSTPGTIDSVTFTEYSRVFLQITGETSVTNQGNLTGQVDALIFNDLIVAGNYFCPGAVTFTVDGTTLGTATTNGTGFFNTTFTVPILSKGVHNVTATNNGVSLIFKVNVLPTLVVTPKSGPIGTVVTFSAYGFDANTMYYLYWQGLTCGETRWYNIMNATTGSDGQFNVTTTYTVPEQVGGSHSVAAVATFLGANTTSLTPFASGSFKVTPTSWVVSTTISNDGTVLSVMFKGLDCSTWYWVDVDNQFMAPGGYYQQLTPNASGKLQIDLIAAGFRPGLHVIALYPYEDISTGVYTYDAFATFNVNTTGDVMWTALDARLVSLEGTIATINTNVGLIKTSVDAINATVTSIDGNVATVKTDLGTLTGTVNTINGNVASIKTDLGTVLAKVTTGTVPIDTTPIWLAVILAAIAAIAAIIAIFQIRSKIAA
jgi:hypothetical protein